MNLKKVGLASSIFGAALAFAASAAAHEKWEGPFSGLFSPANYTHGSGSSFRLRTRAHTNSGTELGAGFVGISATRRNIASGGGRVVLSCEDASGFPGLSDSGWVGSGQEAKTTCAAPMVRSQAHFGIRD